MLRQDTMRSSAAASLPSRRGDGMAYRAARPGASGIVAAARCGLLTLAAASLLLQAGCSRTSQMHTGSVAAAARPAKPLGAMNAEELAGAVRSYGASYERDPKNRDVGLAYAGSLQMTGRNEQSLAVMQQVAIQHPEDRDVLAGYGKALAAAGELQKALDTVRRAQTPDYPDWRLYSAEGAILDQLGRSGEARERYRKALDIQPDEPSVLSNLGMSYLLGKDLKAAETHLRKAAGLPGADSRVRQNLALAVGLQGRFAEAEEIAGAELSPEDAAANIGYLKEMLSQRDTWSELETETPA